MVKIDIPMPKSCEHCPMYYDGYACSLPHENPGMWSFERRPTCPLIEVKDDH